MQDLILTQNESLTMSSKEIAELTGKEKKTIHRDLKVMTNQLYGEVYGTDLYHASSMGVNCDYDERGRCMLIHLDRKHADCLLTGYSAVARMKVIDRWHELENKLPSQALPQNYLEALEHLVTKEKQLIEQAPKVEYFNKVLDTTNGFTATEIATELSMSAIKLNRSLNCMKVQRKIGGRWVLTASNLGNGYTTERTHVDEGGNSRHSMLWTEKGRMFILDLFEVQL